MTEALVRALQQRWGATLKETHISWLLLLETDVYKFKKPVDLGFVDFTDIDKRRHYCEEEIRLNRRTAPDIYLDVVAIGGSESAPELDASRDAALDFAVHMRRFDDNRLLDRLARQGPLDPDHVISLAAVIAAFHERIRGPAPPGAAGEAAAVFAPADENFDDLFELDHDGDDKRLLTTLHDWTQRQFDQLAITFDVRRQSGFVRECHGDLHLGNIYLEDDTPVPFDCIEFNESLRWIDVASDIAFTVMDLMNHDQTDRANLLLNEYLARTGDYTSLQVFDWYVVYRALVRAKVAAIRANQMADDTEARRECSHYLRLAHGIVQRRPVGLIMMCGLSGTGKTTVARQIAAEIGAIHLRSDVERKRLYGLSITDSSHGHGLDIYSRFAGERTFSRLEELAATVLESERPVVVDATFIGKGLRQRFSSLAERLQIPWAIVECTASSAAVRQRLEARKGDASEASFQQYLDQQRNFEAFDDDEQARVVRVDTQQPLGDVATRLNASLAT